MNVPVGRRDVCCLRAHGASVSSALNPASVAQFQCGGSRHTNAVQLKPECALTQKHQGGGGLPCAVGKLPFFARQTPGSTRFRRRERGGGMLDGHITERTS